MLVSIELPRTYYEELRPLSWATYKQDSGLRSRVSSTPWGLLVLQTQEGKHTITQHTAGLALMAQVRALTKVGSGAVTCSRPDSERLSPKWAAHQPPRALSLILPFAQRPCVPGENQPSKRLKHIQSSRPPTPQGQTLQMFISVVILPSHGPRDCLPPTSSIFFFFFD